MSRILMILLLLATCGGRCLAIDWETLATKEVKSEAAKEAIAKYHAKLGSLNQKLAEHIGIAREDLRGDLLEATKAELKMGNLENVKAISSLLTSDQKSHQGTSDSSTTVKKAGPKDFDQRLAGTWRGTWGTSGNSMTIVVHDNGSNVTVRDGRFLILEGQRSEKKELVLAGDRLVVMGWSVKMKLDPFRDQPNHVGILFRSK